MTFDRFGAVHASRLLVAASTVLAPQRLSILIFHRILPERDPLLPGEMHAARFDELMRHVACSFQVLTLGETLEARAAGRLPPRALSITFDDGYADNATVALPILQRHGLKATFFIATGFLDGGRMFNDTVIETLRRTSLQQIDLSEFGVGVRPLATLRERSAAVDATLSAIKYLDLRARDAAVARIHALARHPELPDNLMMRSQQVRQLSRVGMEIGGHTVRHPILRVMPDALAEQEIAAGRTALQALTGAPVDVFAYPNGQPGKDYDERHVEMVRRLGFRGAVSTVTGAATHRCDAFQLPRFTPWDRAPSRWMGRLALERVRARV